MGRKITQNTNERRCSRNALGMASKRKPQEKKPQEKKME